MKMTLFGNARPRPENRGGILMKGAP